MIRVLLSLFLVLGLCPAQRPTRHLTAAARFVPEQAKAGDRVLLEVKAEIEFGWHIYGKKEEMGLPTTLTWKDAGGLVAEGSPEIPDGERHDANGMVSYWIAGTATLKQTFQVPAGQKAGRIKLSGVLDYLPCNDRVCDPPAKEPFEAELTVVAGEAAPAAPATPPAETQGPETKVKLKARFEPATARAGERVELVVDGTIQDGWHIYGSGEEHSPSELRVAELGGLKTAGGAAIPPGERHEITTDLASWWVLGPFTVRQPFLVPDGTAPGKHTVKGVLAYQPCNEQVCDPNEEAPFAATLEVEAGAARAAAQPVAPVASKPSATGPVAGPAAATERKNSPDDLLGLLLAAVLGGLLALVMPCTYPMIPITISFFTKQAEARGGRVLPLSLTYGFGIVLMFALIGLGIAPWIIPFAVHPMTNLVIGVLFVVFALSLFGMIELKPPAFLMDAASKASTKGGYAGVFFMGATLVVTSFACTAPFVGTILSASASLGLMKATLGMAVFGLTMAVPFVILSLLPGRARSLPRSGEWMHVIKVFLGFVEAAAALKFFSNADLLWKWEVLSRELFLLLWTGIFLVAALYLFGVFRLHGEEHMTIGPGRMVGALTTLLFSLYCLYGFFGYRLDQYVMVPLVPPYSAPRDVVGAATGGGGKHAQPLDGHTIIENDFDKALALARTERKPLLVNFTGYI